MKVRELIELLKTADPERMIVLQRDPEGNGFAPLDTVELENAVYQPGDEPHEAIKLEKLTKKLVKDGWTQDDVAKGNDGQKCIVLIPSEEE